MSAQRKRLIAGWVLSGLISVFLIGASGVPKFLEWEGKEEMFARLGFTTSMMVKIGVLEVALALLYLVPRTAFVAAILLTGYLGGATVTHVRVGEPFFMPVIMGVVTWIGLGLRRPEVFKLAWGAGGGDAAPTAP